MRIIAERPAVAKVYSSFSLTSLVWQGDELRVDLFAMPASHSRFLYAQDLAAVPLGPDGLRLAAFAGRRGALERPAFQGRL